MGQPKKIHTLEPPVFTIEIKCPCGATEEVKVSPSCSGEPDTREIECVGCDETYLLKKHPGTSYSLERKLPDRIRCHPNRVAPGGIYTHPKKQRR